MKQYFICMFTRKSIFEAPIDVIGVKCFKTRFWPVLKQFYIASFKTFKTFPTLLPATKRREKTGTERCSNNPQTLTVDVINDEAV